MKKSILLFVFYLLVQNINGQIIEGQVINKATNEPLMGASIYFNGSTIGTLSDENGYFLINGKGQANAKLVASFMGYSTALIDKPTNEEPIIISLSPKIEQLQEVVLTSDPYTREQKLEVFRLEFLGESTAASRSFILNEHDIKLYFNSNEKTLTAYSEKPIIVYNKYLAYEIKFDLQDFKIVFRRHSLSRVDNIVYTVIHGYSRFADMPDASDNKVTVRRRAKSYLASPTHLMQALWNSSLESENFTFYRDGKKITSDKLFVKQPQVRLDLKKFHLKKGRISIKYAGKNRYRSTLNVANDMFFTIDSYGNYRPYRNLIFGQYMAEIRIANMVPYDYGQPSASAPVPFDQVEHKGSWNDILSASSVQEKHLIP